MSRVVAVACSLASPMAKDVRPLAPTTGVARTASDVKPLAPTTGVKTTAGDVRPLAAAIGVEKTASDVRPFSPTTGEGTTTRELRPLKLEIGVKPLADGKGIFDGLADGNPTAREVKPLTPTTGVRTVEEICAAAEICPSLNGTVDASEIGGPLARTLDMMAAASEVRAFPSAGVGDSTLALTGTPIAGMVGKIGMTIDVGELGSDVSIGPRKPGLEVLRSSLSAAEVSIATDADTLGVDVSTGPGILKMWLLRTSSFMAEVSGLEEKP